MLTKSGTLPVAPLALPGHHHQQQRTLHHSALLLHVCMRERECAWAPLLLHPVVDVAVDVVIAVVVFAPARHPRRTTPPPSTTPSHNSKGSAWPTTHPPTLRFPQPHGLRVELSSCSCSTLPPHTTWWRAVSTECDRERELEKLGQPG